MNNIDNNCRRDAKLDTDRGADKWLFKACSVQIFNKEFFSPISMPICSGYTSVSGTSPLFGCDTCDDVILMNN